MHVQVDQQQLHSALQVVTRAVSLRSPRTVLTGVLFAAGEKGLHLTATDLELTIQTKIPAQVSHEGRIVLPARYVHEVVRRIPGGTVTLQVEPESLRAQVSWGRSKYLIHGIPPEQFPPLGEIDGQVLSLTPDLLTNLFQQTAFAVSTDETRPALTGVYLSMSADQVQAIATDGFRVAMSQAPANTGTEAQLILPGRSLQEIGRILQQEQPEEVTVRTIDNQIQFQLGATRVLSRLVEGPYPNILELLPREYPQRVTVDRSELEAALERAALLADGRSASRWLIVITADGDQLTITADDPEVGQAYEEIAAQVEGEGITIGFNARYLLEGLRQIQGDRVVLGLIDPVKAVRMHGADGDNYEYVVFPVRL